MVAKTRRVFEIDVTADPGARKTIREINTSLRRMEGTAKKTQREVQKMGRSFNLLSIAAKAYIALRVARSITDTSDAMILLGARINIVTEETVGVEKAFSDLFDIANLTRQSIEATGTLYARLGFATKALNLEHQDLLDIVQGVNNTLLLSGASAQESASSIIQLSQAFSKGSLDGDEFRSVSEGNVILFGIMQEVLGKTAGELRKFSRDGKLTGDVLAQVLTSDQVKTLQGRVDEIPFTFAQAFTLIGNELSKLAREFEDIFSAITESIVSGLQDTTTTIQFLSAISDGLIPLGELLNVDDLGIGGMSDMLDELKPKFDALTKDAAIGATIYREEIMRLNEQFHRSNEVIAELVKQTTGAKGAYNKLFHPDFFKQQIQAIEMEKALQAASSAAIGLQRDAIAGLNAENEKRLALLARLKEKGESGSGGPTAEQEKRFAAISQSIRTPSQVLSDTLRELEKFRDSGFFDNAVLDAAATNAMVKYGEAVSKTDEELKKVEKSSSALGVALGQTLGDAVGDIGDELFDFAVGLETNFANLVNNILEDIGRLIVKMTLLNALKTGLGGSPVGDFLGFPAPAVKGAAKGAVYDQTGLTPFATGGIINAPTIFPFSGGTGLAGEAGPEAILPLERGSDGKLGVSGTGGPEQVTVVIENNGSDSTVTSSTATADISGTVVNIVLDDIRRGGPLRDAVGGSREF